MYHVTGEKIFCVGIDNTTLELKDKFGSDIKLNAESRVTEESIKELLFEKSLEALS